MTELSVQSFCQMVCHTATRVHLPNFASQMATRLSYQWKTKLPLPECAPRRPCVHLSARTAAMAQPVLDQPMRRLSLPKEAVGREYLLVELQVAEHGPYTFLLDTGLSAELITPHLRQLLEIPPSNLQLEQGLAAGGVMTNVELVQLKDARLVGAEWLPLPPLLAVVADLPQEHMDPAHEVEGMVGMELLQLFDVDMDFPASRLRLWRPGEGTAAAAEAGLIEVPAAKLNDGGTLGIRATTPTAAASPQFQPFVGILDTGSVASALNWQAALAAGLPPPGDPLYGEPGKPAVCVSVIGVDCHPQLLPTATVQFTFAGAAIKGEDGQLAFEAPQPGWQPWAPVLAGVGELPVFKQLIKLGAGDTPSGGPAALIGLDVLAQRRVVIGAGYGLQKRARQLWVSKQ